MKLVFLSIAVLQLEDRLADGTGQRTLHVRLHVQLKTIDFVTLKIEIHV
jgi:hypothetical protein